MESLQKTPPVLSATVQRCSVQQVLHGRRAAWRHNSTEVCELCCGAGSADDVQHGHVRIHQHEHRQDGRPVGVAARRGPLPAALPHLCIRVHAQLRLRLCQTRRPLEVC